MYHHFLVWIKCLIFFVTCTFSESIVTMRRDVITTPVSPYKVRSENRIFAFVDNDSLNNRQNAAKPTKTSREYFIYSTNSRRIFHTTVPQFNDYNQRHSKLTDGQHITSSSTQQSRDSNEIELYHQCYTNDDCKRRLKFSICSFQRSGNICSCLGRYISDGMKCIKKAFLGEYCEQAIQCPFHSICKNEECICMKGYVKRNFICENESLTKRPNFFLALVAGIVFLIVVACLLVLIMGLRRKLIRVRRNALPADIPSVSNMMDARQPGVPNPSYQQIDKPPTYDEAISSSTTLLTLSVEDVNSQPPTYTQILSIQDSRPPQSSLTS